jgi:hypothetical protein
MELLNLLCKARDEIIGGLVVALVVGIITWLSRWRTRFHHDTNTKLDSPSDSASDVPRAIVADGNKSVAIGGNLSRSTIFTGDQSVKIDSLTLIVSSEVKHHAENTFPGMNRLLSLNDSHTMSLLTDLVSLSRWDESASKLIVLIRQLQENVQVLTITSPVRFFARPVWEKWLENLRILGEMADLSPRALAYRDALIHELETRIRYVSESEFAKHNWEESYALLKALIALLPQDKEAINRLQELESMQSVHFGN